MAMADILAKPAPVANCLEEHLSLAVAIMISLVSQHVAGPVSGSDPPHSRASGT
jgi:hypothetical protein